MMQFTRLPWLITAAWLPSLHAAEPIERVLVTAPSYQTQWLNSDGARWVQGVSTPFTLQFTDLFAGLPGVQADPRTTAAQDAKISIRGFGSRSAFGSRGIEFLVDGIAQSTPDGQLQLNGLLLDDIAYLEVLRGPMASVFGNSAGGVIAAQSAPLEQAPSAQLYWQYTHQSQQYRWRWSQPGWTLAFQETSNQGFRPHQRSVRQQASTRISHDIAEDWQLTARLDAMRDPLLQDPLALTPAEWQQDPHQTSSNALTFNSRKTAQQWSASSQLQSSHSRFALWHQQRQITQYQAQSGIAPTSSGGVIALERIAQGANSRWQLPYSSWFDDLPLDTEITLNTEQSREHRQGFVNAQGQKGPLRRDEAAKVQSLELAQHHRWSISDAVHLALGHRVQQLNYKVEDFFINAANPDDSGRRRFVGHGAAASLQWQPTLHSQWQLSYGEGFEAPTLSDMAYQANASGLNLSLRQATNQQWELNWRQVHSNVRYEWSSYHIHVDDELAVLQSNAGRTVFYNAAQTRRVGSELALAYQNNAHLWQFTVNVARSRFAGGPYSGNRLPGVAERQLQVSWQWQANTNWQHDITVSAQSDVAVDDANSYVAPGRVIASLSSRYHFNRDWQWYLQVHNATSQRFAGTVLVNAQNSRWIEPAQPRLWSTGILGYFQLE